jgi:putative alpha-1,2-mannosidase
VRQALTELYPDDPGGFPGNDDMGEMSAWYVFAALGLYPEIPGRDVLALATPTFARVTIRLGSGQTLTLRAPHAGPAMPFIRALRIGGRVWTRPWITLSQLRAGRRLDFRLSAQPDPRWGAAPANAPPSFPPTAATGCA